MCIVVMSRRSNVGLNMSGECFYAYCVKTKGVLCVKNLPYSAATHAVWKNLREISARLVSEFGRDRLNIHCA